MLLLASIPGVLYAAAVAAVSSSKRKATFVLATAYMLVVIAVVSVAIYNHSRGVTIFPALAPLGAVATLGAMFAFGLGVTLTTHGLSRKKKLLAQSV